MSNRKEGKLKMHLMTIMDLVSCWFEVAPIKGDPNSFDCNCIFIKVKVIKILKATIGGL